MRLLPSSLTLLSLSAFASSTPSSSFQRVLDFTNSNFYSSFSSDSSSRYHTFGPIKRVAVIGGGPNGLLYTDTLRKHGFEVRMFEKAPQPGGNWFYTDMKPLHASFPNRPTETSAFVPDVPDMLPLTKVYEDGDEGKTLEWRMQEHAIPSSVWKNMHSTVPPFMMHLPNIEMPPDTPWQFNQHHMQRYVRAYASSLGLSSNDDESSSITSYSTRVERVQKQQHGKHAGKWVLTLRKLQILNSDPFAPASEKSQKKARVDWWEEVFDAVIVGSNSESGAPFVPSIPGLDDWAHAFPDKIVHVREYRTADEYRGKKILIVGGALSGMGVANDLVDGGAQVFASVAPLGPNVFPILKGIRDHFPANSTFIPIIDSFGPVPSEDSRQMDAEGVRAAQIKLVNGTTISGFDNIILATGYRKSFPFLVDYANSTIKGREEPRTTVAPILTDGTHLRSLHWTGHYIDDPTLLLAVVHPYGLGVYQALGAAKSWSGQARIPSREEMWKQYPGPGRDVWGIIAMGEVVNRLFVTWLNNEALEFGGRLVEPMPIKYRQSYEYYSEKAWAPNALTAEHFDRLDAMPRSQWPSRNGRERDFVEPEFDNSEGVGEILGYRVSSAGTIIGEDDWMGFQNQW